MSSVEAIIAENLAAIRGRITDAAARSGRNAGDIKLVAVTKFMPVDYIRILVALGCKDIGESRPQELWEKSAALDDLLIRWHMIGHLQRNKVRRTLPIVDIIHSIDSERLAAAVDEECSSDRKIKILLEVNISGEAAKHGFAPAEVERFLGELPNYKSLQTLGLMCMAGLEGGMETARRDFTALRELRDRLKRNCPPEIAIDELSMGMSDDFEAAIEEGATIVRIGSALFDGIEWK